MFATVPHSSHASLNQRLRFLARSDSPTSLTKLRRIASLSFACILIFDGNKRTGLLAALTFLLDSGVTPSFNEDEMYETIDAVARSEGDIADLTSVFREANGPKRRSTV